MVSNNICRLLRLAGLRVDGWSRTDYNTCLGLAKAIKLFVNNKVKIPRYLVLDEMYLTFIDKIAWTIKHTKAGERFVLVSQASSVIILVDAAAYANHLPISPPLPAQSLPDRSERTFLLSPWRRPL